MRSDMEVTYPRPPWLTEIYRPRFVRKIGSKQKKLLQALSKALVRPRGQPMPAHGHRWPVCVFSHVCLHWRSCALSITYCFAQTAK
jgi:hypothetical protein